VSKETPLSRIEQTLPTHPESLWIPWALVTATCGAFAWSIGALITSRSLFIGILAMGFLAGTSLALGQTMLLSFRLRWPSLGHFSALGGLVAVTAFILFAGPQNTIGLVVAAGIGGAIPGVLLGPARRLISRRTSHHTAKWVAINTGSLIAGTWVGWYSGYMLRSFFPASPNSFGIQNFTLADAVSLALGGSLGSLVFGVLTGAGLVWLLNGTASSVPTGGHPNQ
jgi:hypothetical protein